MQVITLHMKAISWNDLYKSPHWSVRSRLANEIHEAVFFACKEQKIAPIKSVACEIFIYADFKGSRRHDPDNICEKLYIDGLVHAGIILDDNCSIVRMIGKTATINCPENLVEIEIMEVVD